MGGAEVEGVAAGSRHELSVGRILRQKCGSRGRPEVCLPKSCSAAAISPIRAPAPAATCFGCHLYLPPGGACLSAHSAPIKHTFDTFGGRKWLIMFRHLRALCCDGRRAFEKTPNIRRPSRKPVPIEAPPGAEQEELPPRRLQWALASARVRPGGPSLSGPSRTTRRPPRREQPNCAAREWPPTQSGARQVAAKMIIIGPGAGPGPWSGVWPSFRTMSLVRAARTSRGG